MTGFDMRRWIDLHAGQRLHNFIDGEWVPSASGKTYPLFEAARPSSKLADVADSTAEDVDRAAAAADEAFRTWRHTPGSVRASILYRFADLLEQHKEELAYILSAEQGKVLSEAFGEVQRAAAETRFNAGEALRLDGITLPSEHPEIRTQVVRIPIGVIAAIAPWNFPVVTPVRKIAPALACGCTVVLKPSSLTPWSSVKIVELLAEAGVPRGVVNLVTGSGAKAGDPLVAHPFVRGISFTGSSDLGMRINGIAASRLAKTQLEMGGKNAAIVLDYDDLEYAAEQIVSAAFACSGQRCTAISRVIVLKNQAQALCEQLLKRMKNIQVGPAWSATAQMGPLIDRKHFDSVMSYIEEGVREGAQLVFGGERVLPEHETEGWYMTPALFTDVRPDMKIAKEEIFGPVLSVLEANSVEEAMEIANATEYGLAAAVFTQRMDWAEQVTEAIETGMIHVNHGTASQAHVPFGGVKTSGYGAYSIGHSNLEFFTHLKAIYVKSR